MKKLLFAFAAALILITELANPAPAQEWPQRTIRIVVSFGPGGGADIIGRIVCTEYLNPHVMVMKPAKNRV
jgi:tripartite-type tricarboxylate transporter receptor subunit TctC